MQALYVVQSETLNLFHKSGGCIAAGPNSSLFPGLRTWNDFIPLKSFPPQRDRPGLDFSPGPACTHS